MLENEIDVYLPINMFCDSQVAIHVSSNPEFLERRKRIEVYHHFIQDKI